MDTCHCDLDISTVRYPVKINLFIDKLSEGPSEQ